MSWQKNMDFVLHGVILIIVAMSAKIEKLASWCSGNIQDFESCVSGSSPDEAVEGSLKYNSGMV